MAIRKAIANHTPTAAVRDDAGRAQQSRCVGQRRGGHVDQLSQVAHTGLPASSNAKSTRTRPGSDSNANASAIRVGSSAVTRRGRVPRTQIWSICVAVQASS